LESLGKVEEKKIEAWLQINKLPLTSETKNCILFSKKSKFLSLQISTGK